MIKFFARGRCAQAGTDNPVTTGSVGIPVQFYFSQEWDALQKIAVFRAGDTAVDVALTGTVATVPAEVLTTAGLPLMIGVYGAAADGTIVIPTVWAKAETIKAGTAPSGVDPAEPTPSWVAQVQAIASEALETAEAVQAAAERGDFDGADGVSPTVTITSIEGGHRVTITSAAHPEGQSFDVMDGTSGSGELLVVAYDSATPGTVPDVTEIADGFDAGKAVIACASDLDGGGHVLPLTSLERSGGSVTALRFSAGGWTLSAGQVLGAWIWALSEDAATEDLVLTFTAAWDSGADAYVVTTTATLAQIDEALAAGQRIDARLQIDNAQLLRQGTVYAERTGSQLVSVTIGYFGVGVAWYLEGDSSGWYLDRTPIETVDLDDTLTQYGKAAEAAAVGQALAGKGTYSKPAGGIPAEDLAPGVIPTVPSLDGYATEQWVQQQGYLKQHQSLSAYRTAAAQDLIDAGKADKMEEITVADDGAVTQELAAGKVYHFTGDLTALTLTLAAPAAGQRAQYHLDFLSGATAPTVTIPQSVTMPDGWSVEASTRYEIDILDGYGVAQSWAQGVTA